jgi:hypothetical protein
MKKALVLLFGIAACSNNNGGGVSFSLTSRAAPGAAFGAPISGSAASVLAAGDTTVIALGSDTIILRSVDVVLRKIELKKVESAGCDSSATTSDCEEFEVGTTLVSLPLGAAATAAVVAINAPAGQYDELEFEIHRAELSNDSAFLTAHPELANASIRVTGTYSQAGTRSDFTFTSDLDASQEMAISPPVTVTDGGSINVTLRVDVGGWFLNAGGTALVSPASANKGQTNESLVKSNIEASLKAFRDDNHDGRDDDHEGS